MFQPKEAHLDSQFASLAEQIRRPDQIVAVIADLTSAKIVNQLGQKYNLKVKPYLPPRSLDAVRAFEFGLLKALSISPPETLFAFCDQDDIWHKDRLSACEAEMTDPQVMLVHSDARLVSQTGEPLGHTVFSIEKRIKHPGLRGLLYRNNVTGMTAMFRASLAQLALPFPRQAGVHFYHDLWLALLAEAVGKTALINRPLVDYRQHGGNVMGAIDRRKVSLGFGLPNMVWLRREAASYALARYLGQSVYNRVTVSGANFAPGKVKQLRPYLAHTRGAEWHLMDMVGYALRGKFGHARLAFGQAVVSVGRLVWAVKNAMTIGRTENLRQFDARVFSMSPGMAPEEPQVKVEPAAKKAIQLIDRRKFPKWTPELIEGEPSLNVLVPTLNPTEIFAGIATAIDLGLLVAQQGVKVRFIATDLPVASREVSHTFIVDRMRADPEIERIAANVSLHCGVTEGKIPATIDDNFLTTAWWSAHIASALIRDFGFTTPNFFYLIQDYEPGFYPWGPEFADAEASYDLNFTPVFNTTLLKDYFASLGYGFAQPDSMSFQPSIDVDTYLNVSREKDASQKKILALYGRPEVARNMFVTAIEALSDFVKRADLGPDDIDIVSVGLAHGPIEIANGVKVISRGKLPYAEYPPFLGTVDVGLSLMLSPHPSHPPLEMAAAGVRVVTNTFGPKDLSKLSPAISSVKADPAAIAVALEDAWRMEEPSLADRKIDLGKLGEPLSEVAKVLTSRLSFSHQGPSEERKRIILHIGAPKCGSTFLQMVLRSNQAKLAEAGINYPHDGGSHPGNAPQLSDLTAEKINADLKDAHTVIYSHEDLFVPRAGFNQFFDELRKCNVEVTLLCFLRPFAEFVFGSYSQTLKQNFEDYVKKGQAFEGQTFEEFATSFAPRLRVDQFLRQWSKYIPRSHIHLAGHDQIRPTVEALLPEVALNWEVKRHLTNPSLRISDCEEISLAINKGDQDAEALREIFRKAFFSTDLPDTGRSADRIAMVEMQFNQSRNEIKRLFDLDLPLAKPRE